MSEGVRIRSVADAAEALRAIGELERAIARIDARLAAKVGKLQQLVRGKLDAPKAELAELDAALERFAAKKRADLLQAPKKSVSLATGEIGWRNERPTVVLAGEEVDARKAEAAVLAELKTRKLKRFMRVRESVDRQAMLKDQDKAKTVPGVTIVADRETFFRKPLAPQVAQAA